MVFSFIEESYQKVNEYWKKGLSPTFAVRLSPTEDISNLSDYTYINFNEGTEFVESTFIITSSKPGFVKDGKFGHLGVLKNTSEGFTSEFFFQQCAIEVSDWIASNANDGNVVHAIVFEIFTKVLGIDSLVSSESTIVTQEKIFGNTGKGVGYDYSCPYGTTPACSGGNPDTCICISNYI